MNYENNILLQDECTTRAIYACQLDYIAQSAEIALPAVLDWPWYRRI